jgi:hypothetical protein
MNITDIKKNSFMFFLVSLLIFAMLFFCTPLWAASSKTLWNRSVPVDGTQDTKMSVYIEHGSTTMNSFHLSFKGGKEGNKDSIVFSGRRNCLLGDSGPEYFDKRHKAYMTVVTKYTAPYYFVSGLITSSKEQTPFCLVWSSSLDTIHFITGAAADELIPE